MVRHLIAITAEALHIGRPAGRHAGGAGRDFTDQDPMAFGGFDE